MFANVDQFEEKKAKRKSSQKMVQSKDNFLVINHCLNFGQFGDFIRNDKTK